jgi:hypothetical protein
MYTDNTALFRKAVIEPNACSSVNADEGSSFKKEQLEKIVSTNKLTAES